MAFAERQLSIFVSSPYEDLTKYRGAVRDALSARNAHVRGMEYFQASTSTALQESLKALRSCDAYIGIFGMRYGTPDEETGLSISHLEYQEARRLKLPIRIYLFDEDNQPVLARFVDTGANAESLRALKAEMRKNHLIERFTTPEDLALKIERNFPTIVDEVRAIAAQPPQQEAPVPQGRQALYRIHNRWKDNEYLNIETGRLESSPIEPGWLSAQWSVEAIPGTRFVRFHNRWKLGHYIHLEHGPVVAEPIEFGWWSAMWTIDRLPNSAYLRIRNRWKEDLLLNIEPGRLQCSPTEPGWWSAMWTFDLVE